MAGIFKAYDIRGLYPEQLNEDLARKIGRAYIVFTGAEKVVVGHDMRPDSVPLKEALFEGMTMQGADVIDIGMCSTPMSYFANGTLKAEGSIMITASHNPEGWNGFKLCKANAVPISGATGIGDIEALVEADDFSAAAEAGSVSTYDIAPEYGEFLKKHSKLNRKMKIVCDFANSMGSFEIAGIRDMFEIIPMYEELDGSFPESRSKSAETGYP